ncbi:glycerol-3-phosphate O-acyltransferase 1 [Gaeumannomyces tritici R3-111a-1]|uniref:Glycerol-3-phosphate O-acyltransferase 1 n=1 Tax=Gaeumannomyces tritici (strain R3-111a-1) TaxID=644352 RepID=J3NFL7_GAET3|nr:glycerol-3-phosphate O-acyltransferase 1 [Gaeumannomyces tritici R3-111a-1]EJT80057.1 glycerol-3-phosphate O-acyltransferase 1 [Gaeumannomyces tritici R3-111a-1]
MATNGQAGAGAGVPAREADRGRAPMELYPMVDWKYDSFLWVMSITADLFFREIHPRSSWKIPRNGPVLFVAAPHANQFVDALILQRTLKREAARRVSLLIAQKSVHGFIGWASRQVGAVPVGRAQDSARPASGTIYLPDPIGDPTLVRGYGTRFDREAEVGGGLFLPSVKGKTGSNVDIAQIIGPEEIRIRRPLKGKLPMQQLTGRDDIDEDGNFTNKEHRGCAANFQGTKFKTAPHIDQSKVFEAVFARLRSGGCVGIFPEGGSHDRTELLPLKPGVSIMALGAMAENPGCGVKIVPVGMNYFHAHKFRSRAVVEFGAAIDVPAELVEKYKGKERREAVGTLLDQVHQGLSTVTVSTPDYDTLMLIQAARRLYNPTGKKLPLPVVVELNRRLALGYERYKNDERVIRVLESVKKYNQALRYLNVRDHQVQVIRMSWPRVVRTFLARLIKLVVLLFATLPGLVLFFPVFVIAKIISIRKAEQALAASTVKIQGRDVMATWKLLVSLVVAPCFYNFYCTLVAYKVSTDGFWGLIPTNVVVLNWKVVALVVWTISWPIFIGITFAALRFGEIGMDIFKSLRPLLLCMLPTSKYNLQKLQEQRAELSAEVTHLVNTLGPELFPDFEQTRLIKAADGAPLSPLSPITSSKQPRDPGQQAGKKRRDSEQSSASAGPSEPPTPPPGGIQRRTTQSSRAIPRNESFSNIGRAGIFATRPPSRNRSRTSSAGGGGGLGGFGSMGGFPISGFTALDSQEGFDEASRKIREAMRERGEMRRRQSGLDRHTSSGSGGMEIGADSDDEENGESYYDEARKKMT